MLLAFAWTLGYILLVVISIMVIIAVLFVCICAFILGLFWLMEVIANLME